MSSHLMKFNCAVRLFNVILLIVFSMKIGENWNVSVLYFWQLFIRPHFCAVWHAHASQSRIISNWSVNPSVRQWWRTCLFPVGMDWIGRGIFKLVRHSVLCFGDSAVFIFVVVCCKREYYWLIRWCWCVPLYSNHIHSRLSCICNFL